MACGGMVRGLPHIEQEEQLCEACLTGKQRRTSFPQQSTYRASDRLELVHVDLCGPIAPAKPGGRRYFLLLVDNYSRFMWATLLTSKDEATGALARFQAAAEAESGRRLRTLRTDQGDEFTSGAFAAHCAETGGAATPHGAVLTSAERGGGATEPDRRSHGKEHAQGEGRAKLPLGRGSTQ